MPGNLFARSTVQGREAGILARMVDLALVCTPGKINFHTGTNESELKKCPCSPFLHLALSLIISWRPTTTTTAPNRTNRIGRHMERPQTLFVVLSKWKGKIRKDIFRKSNVDKILCIYSDAFATGATAAFLPYQDLRHYSLHNK